MKKALLFSFVFLCFASVAKPMAYLANAIGLGIPASYGFIQAGVYSNKSSLLDQQAAMHVNVNVDPNNQKFQNALIGPFSVNAAMWFAKYAPIGWSVYKNQATTINSGLYLRTLRNPIAQVLFASFNAGLGVLAIDKLNQLRSQSYTQQFLKKLS